LVGSGSGGGEADMEFVGERGEKRKGRASVFETNVYNRVPRVEIQPAFLKMPGATNVEYVKYQHLDTTLVLSSPKI
jgi:hypothetical protein